MVHREAILDRQYLQERIADAAIALVTSACTLSRWDHSEQEGRAIPAERSAAELYLRMANRRFDQALRSLRQNDDRLTTEAANDALRMCGLSGRTLTRSPSASWLPPGRRDTGHGIPRVYFKPFTIRSMSSSLSRPIRFPVNRPVSSERT
jgi:hypothetical protein